MTRLDDLLSKPTEVDTGALERGWPSLQAELGKVKHRGWRFDAAVVLALCWSLALATAVVLGFAGQTDFATLGDHAPSIAMLLVTGAICTWVAMAPKTMSRVALGLGTGAVGVAGLFIETHQDPDNAPSDGPNMIPLDRMEELLSELLEYDRLRKARPQRPQPRPDARTEADDGSLPRRNPAADPT